MNNVTIVYIVGGVVVLWLWLTFNRLVRMRVRAKEAI